MELTLEQRTAIGQRIDKEVASERKQAINKLGKDLKHSLAKAKSRRNQELSQSLVDSLFFYFEEIEKTLKQAGAQDFQD